ncbi:unnamed protein product [Caretta caretta]
MRLWSCTETLDQPVFPKRHAKKTNPDQAQTSSTMTEMQGGDGGPEIFLEGMVTPPEPEIQVPRWRDALNPDQVLTAEDRNFFLEMKRLEAEERREIKCLEVEMEAKHLEAETELKHLDLV